MNDNNPKRRASATAWNEADTCRKCVVPKLQAVGWDNEPHSIAEQRTFTDGRIVVRGNQTQRQKDKGLNGDLDRLPMLTWIMFLKFLDYLLEKYATDDELQLVAVRKHLPDVLKLPPISRHGNVNEIIGKFGGAERLRETVGQLQTLLYAQ